MQHLLYLPGMAVRHKMAQAKMYLKVMEDVTHLLHGTIREVRGRRLKRGKSWMAEAEETRRKICELEDLK